MPIIFYYPVKSIDKMDVGMTILLPHFLYNFHNIIILFCFRKKMIKIFNLTWAMKHAAFEVENFFHPCHNVPPDVQTGV